MGNLIKLLDRPVAYQPAFAMLRAGKVKAGPVAAVFLSQLVYWHNRMDGAWIYKTQADITTETSLTRDEQETARKRLIAIGVLEEQLRGVPATMHYRVNSERLEALLLEYVGNPVKKETKQKTRMGNYQNVETPQTGMVQSRKQECGDTANKNVETPQKSMRQPNKQACGEATDFLTGDYTENTQESTQDKKTSCPVAAQPDDAVMVTDQAKQVLTYLNQQTGSRYQVSKTSMEHIRARLGEGFSAEELRLVVDYTNEKWSADLQMAEYLRPTTLFLSSKFPGYLQAATKWKEAGRPVRRNGEWVSSTASRATFQNVDYSLPQNSGFRS
ncbi:conserved phage C-terminal domain-containing protein [Kosakonia cowanii]|uniref:conserved phage C-terminal domain-containing protein n=1 Tax=Kosakonia cowanii TaxID=208223 RepID=UPI0028A5C0ED|nr:conserved phage C-terminal domain-containing protein [Kosakonia cowanii]